MRELVVISGKGGTGKTTLAASFAALAQGRMVVADCDVDAADLHLVLKPDIRTRTAFRSGHKASVRARDCVACGVCASVCRFEAVSKRTGDENVPRLHYAIDGVACEGCGVCVRFCPAHAIDFPEQTCGEWYLSDTRFGPMVHAELAVAAENSGKLVTLVRTEAKRVAEEQGAEWVIVDGSPGIGCPVIASLTAATCALIVTEPTVAGDHDLRRISALTRQLNIPAQVCINKYDINPEAAEQIRRFAEEQGMAWAGMLRYDRVASDAQRAERTVVEHGPSALADDIRGVWQRFSSSYTEEER